MAPVNLAISGLWAKMLEKQTEARFWKPPWSLDLQVAVVWAGEHPYHRPRPPAVQAAPSVLVRLAPKTRPPPPSQPRPAWGCSPEENDVHCGWRQQLSWSWGIRTGPQGSHRPGRSHTGLGAAAWSWLKGRCHLVTRRCGHPKSPWEEPPLVTKATSPRATLP